MPGTTRSPAWHSSGSPAATAATTIRRALHEASAAHERPALLASAVEIFRGTADVAAARGAADELAAITADSTLPVLKAFSDHAAGTVLLAAISRLRCDTCAPPPPPGATPACHTRRPARR